jgi:hypothetical protein
MVGRVGEAEMPFRGDEPRESILDDSYRGERKSRMSKVEVEYWTRSRPERQGERPTRVKICIGIPVPI